MLDKSAFVGKRNLTYIYFNLVINYVSLNTVICHEIWGCHGGKYQSVWDMVLHSIVEGPDV